MHREEVLNANAPFEADEFFGKKRDDFQIRTTEYLALLLFGEFVVRLFVEKLVPPRSEEDGGVLESARNGADVTRVVIARNPFVEPVVGKMPQGIYGSRHRIGCGEFAS